MKVYWETLFCVTTLGKRRKYLILFLSLLVMVWVLITQQRKWWLQGGRETPVLIWAGPTLCPSRGVWAETQEAVWRERATSQVWALTQFYSVDYSQSRIRVKKMCNPGPRQPFLTVSWDIRSQRGTPDSKVSLCLCSSGSITQGKSMVILEGCIVAQKALQGSETRQRMNARE